MMDQILDFFKNIPIPDYIIFFISVGFFIVFIYAGIEKIYKAYLGLILGLFIFSLTNLTLNSLNNNDIGLNGIKNYFINHKNGIGFYSILFIPFLSILIPLNHNINFRISQKKTINYIVIFLFGFFFFSFLITIFLSIINNKFLFSLDNVIIIKIKESFIIEFIYNYFSTSHIFNFLINYDYIINLSIISFIFYKMSIGGIIDYLSLKFFKFATKILEKKTNNEAK